MNSFKLTQEGRKANALSAKDCWNTCLKTQNRLLRKVWHSKEFGRNWEHWTMFFSFYCTACLWAFNWKFTFEFYWIWIIRALKTLIWAFKASSPKQETLFFWNEILKIINTWDSWDVRWKSELFHKAFHR